MRSTTVLTCSMSHGEWNELAERNFEAPLRAIASPSWTGGTVAHWDIDRVRST
jgi:hypothetical protein